MGSVPVLLRKEKSRGKVLVFGVFAKVFLSGRLYRAGLLYVSPFKGYLSLPRKIYVALRAEGRGVGIGDWKPLSVEERAYEMLSGRNELYGTIYSPVSSHLRLSAETGLLRTSLGGGLRLDAPRSALRERVITGHLRILD